MLDFVRNHSLDPTKLRGQAYDGAGNMSSKTNGAAALITSQFPFTLYVHCASHSLNLTVVSSLEEVRVNRVSIFFSAHHKRQKKFEEAIENTQPESHVRKLKDLCRPRWIKKIDALDRFQVLHSSVVTVFIRIVAAHRIVAALE